MTSSIATEIETIVTRAIAKKEHINYVVGTIRGGERWVKGWGSFRSVDRDADLDSPTAASRPPDGDTLFEIGSVTKVFTSTLLSLLVERGQIDLNTPVARLGEVYQKLPENVTPESLATHTSGLPRVPENLKPYHQKNPQNPYADYGFDALHEYLKQHDGQPGQNAGTIDYSNLGVGILGNILAQHGDRSYEAAIVESVCDPLGLSQTRITLSQEQKSRFAIAYSENGKPTPPWDLPTLAGAGALRSTANDMLTFLAANLQPEQTPIASAILNTHPLRYETFAPVPGVINFIDRSLKWIRRLRGTLVTHENRGIALGWFVDYLPTLDRQVYWHNGGTGGYRSFCGFVLGTDTGVVVLSNYGDILASMFGQYAIEEVGMKILETMNV
ncbi:MAG: serine hydrolase domain-containing protein [Cyanobacteriota bacterium]|nr:serine hydrolase domain-containing protein [Cyanobacteriota bacterium]